MNVRIFVISILFIWSSSSFSQSGNLFTQQYTVAPTFPNITTHGGYQQHRPTAKEILEKGGVQFGKNATAIYNPSTSTLIVRNTKDQIAVVEALIDSLHNEVETQIYCQIWEIIFPNPIYAQLMNPDQRKELNLEPTLDSILKPISPIKGEFPSRGIFRQSLRDTEHYSLVRNLNHIIGIEILSAGTLMLRTNTAGTIETKDRRYGVKGSIEGKGTRLAMSYYLPNQGEPLVQDTNSLEPDIKATIWDGNTAVIEKRSKNSITWVLVKAQLQDPAGKPINPKRTMPGSATEISPAPLPLHPIQPIGRKRL